MPCFQSLSHFTSLCPPTSDPILEGLTLNFYIYFYHLHYVGNYRLVFVIFDVEFQLSKMRIFFFHLHLFLCHCFLSRFKRFLSSTLFYIILTQLFFHVHHHVLKLRFSFFQGFKLTFKIYLLYFGFRIVFAYLARIPAIVF